MTEEYEDSMSYIGGGANKPTERRKKFAIKYALLIISHGGNIQKTIGIRFE